MSKWLNTLLGRNRMPKKSNAPLSLAITATVAGRIATIRVIPSPKKILLKSLTIDFGDGNSVNDRDDLRLTHEYAAPGTYIVMAAATDYHGQTATTRGTIVIEAAPPVVVPPPTDPAPVPDPHPTPEPPPVEPPPVVPPAEPPPVIPPHDPPPVVEPPPVIPPVEPPPPVIVPPPVTPPPPPPASGADVTITLDASRTYQAIHGFGCSQRTFGDGHLLNPSSGAPEAAIIISEADKAKVYDVAFRDLGLTRQRTVLQGAYRQPTESGPARFDGVFGDAHIEQAAQIEARGVTTFWDSVLTYDPWVQTPAQVAEWNMKSLRYWKSWGREFAYFSVANEPGYAAQGQMTGAFQRDSILALGRALALEGFSTKLVATDGLNPDQAADHLAVIMADAEARSYIGALCCHLYGTPLSNMARVREYADRYGLPLWMSEYSSNGYPALDWANTMHEMLVTHSCSAVDYMWGFLGSWDSAQLVTLNADANRNYTGYTLRDEYHVMGQWSKHIRPGAVRIAATSNHPEVKISAFIKANKRVVVAYNAGYADYTVSLPGSWSMTSTSGSATASLLPQRSVTTFVEV